MWKEIEEERDAAAGHELLQGLARDRAAALAVNESNSREGTRQ
jgi:hypothetical protein